MENQTENKLIKILKNYLFEIKMIQLNHNNEMYALIKKTNETINKLSDIADQIQIIEDYNNILKDFKK